MSQALRPAQLASRAGIGELLLNNHGVSFCTPLCLPELESITIVFPLLERRMPYYAGHSPVVMGPSFLRAVPYSEVQRIKIKGPYTYRPWLRGSVNTKRQFLGQFIKDVNEIWKDEASYMLDGDDARHEVPVQAGVLQYLEGPLRARRGCLLPTKIQEIWRRARPRIKIRCFPECMWAFQEPYRYALK